MDKIINKIFKYPFSNVHINEIFNGSSVAFIYRILGLMGAYVFAFIVCRYYGANSMGIYSLSLSVLIVLEMLGTVGFGNSVLRFIGQLSAESNLGATKQLYKNMLEIIVPVSVFLAASLYILSPKISLLIFHNPDLVTALRLISFVAPAYVVNSVNTELIRGLKNIKFSEYLRSLHRPLFSIPGLFIVSLFTCGWHIPVIAMISATFGACMISTVYVVKKINSFSGNSVKELSKTRLLSVSAPMILTAFSFVVMENVNTIMLGAFSTVKNVAIYNVAARLSSLTSVILLAVSTIAGPKFSELYWSQKTEELKKTISFSAKLIFWIAMPVLFIYLLFPGFFMGIFGKEFIAGKYALVILTLGQFVNASSGPVGIFLNMTGKQRVFSNIVLTAAALNIILNYILIPKYGINGVAVSTAISVSFWNVIAVWYVKTKTGIKTFYIPVLVN